MRGLLVSLGAVVLLCHLTWPSLAADKGPLPDVVEFNRDIRPLLSDNCYFCHGPDKNKREADLRLDTPTGLFGDQNADVKPTVIPGKPDASELFRRITSSDPEQKMPPPKGQKSLTPRDIQLIKKWIEQGAKLEGHWAFLPLKRAAAPGLSTQFSVLSTQHAVRETPGRGQLPPNPVDLFIWKRLELENLAPSPGADRVTLIRRLKFDLIGLPPSPDEVAAFLNDSSADAYEKLVDRLLQSPHFGERLAMWWLDLVRYADTVGYHGDQDMSVSPFRQYVIESFNANKRFDQFTIEQLAGDLLPNPTREQLIASGYNRLGMMSAEGGVQDKEYLSKYIAERVRNASGTWLGITLGCCECHDHKFDPLTSRDFYRFEAFFADIQERGLYSGAHADGNWGPNLKLATPEQTAALADLDRQIADVKKVLQTSTSELVAAQAEWEKGLADGTAPKTKANEPPKDIAAILAVAVAQRTETQAAELATHFRSLAPQLESERKQLAALEKSREDLDSRIPSTLVTASVAPRMVRVLKRGNWMDDSGEEVQPAFPAALSPPRESPTRLTRLELAKWIVSPDNPLTARVFVNRLWKLFFGAGLSRNLDDLGAQGDWPSHPLLLDHLAGSFADSGWDVKQLIKSLVMSNTYRQSSLTSSELREADAYNRWLARQGRFRLDAELVRDNALAISGLLVTKIGGASVKPYQPPGYFAYLNFPAREWQNGAGEELYRRGLYTHWQRQYLHPSLLAFDAPCREECTADRARSNTPLQSLVLLNDPTYVEAARAFAELIFRSGGATTRDRLNFAYRKAVSRDIKPAEAEVLERLLQSHLDDYKSDATAAKELLGVGAKRVPADLNSSELAAWTSVARTILNLHETITRN